jgi:hypothetical protein
LASTSANLAGATTVADSAPGANVVAEDVSADAEEIAGDERLRAVLRHIADPAEKISGGARGLQEIARAALKEQT